MTLPTLHLSADFPTAGTVDLTPFGASDSPGITVTRGTTSLVTTGFVSDAGSLDTTLDNENREFDPNNASSPFAPDVRRNIPLVVTANWDSTDYTLLTPTVDGWPQTYPLNGKHQAVQLRASDGVKLFSNAQAALSAPAEYSGARINRMITAAGFSGPTDIAHGDCIVGPLPYGTVSCWSHMTDVANAEWGNLYFTQENGITFDDRDRIFSDSRFMVSNATYVQSGGFNYSDLAQASPQVVNDCTITHNDQGDQVNAQDPTSIAIGLSSQNLSLPIQTRTAAQQYANWVVARYKDEITTFSSVTFTPSNEPGATFDLWAELFSRELGDLVTVVLDPLELDVNLQPVLSGDVLTRDCWIRGIVWNLQSQPWSVTFYLQDASWRTGLFTWDVSEYDGADVWGL